MRRYVYQHGYNLSMPELVDKIASPTVRASMMEWTYKKLDSFPTPIDYADALASGDQTILLCWDSPDKRMPQLGLYSWHPWRQLPLLCCHGCLMPRLPIHCCIDQQKVVLVISSAGTCPTMAEDSEKPCKCVKLWHAAGLPQLKALWESYHDAFSLDALLVPATIATARPISDVEPYMSVNGKKARSHSPHSIP